MAKGLPFCLRTKVVLDGRVYLFGARPQREITPPGRPLPHRARLTNHR
jgi:hypothetical protein